MSTNNLHSEIGCDNSLDELPDWFKHFVQETISNAKHEVNNFEAGRIQKFFDNWCNLTSDPYILDMVKGYKIQFESIATQLQEQNQIQFSDVEAESVQQEIEKLLSKGVIVLCDTVPDDAFISNIFVRPKSDGTYRMILNLSKLNPHIVYAHFKMDSLQSVIQMMTPMCFMASCDIKDAYYSVGVTLSDQKYLVFKWRGNYYQYTCFPNGLASAPRDFTKLLKPALSTLRKQGHQSVAYIDDFYLQGNSKVECMKNVEATVNLLTSLGFVIHPEKSVLVPRQQINFLGFILDSRSMTVSLPAEKETRIIDLCNQLIALKRPIIRFTAQVIGTLISVFPAVPMGPMHYRQLELDKSYALKQNYGNFDAKMKLSDASLSELRWWTLYIRKSESSINKPKPHKTITSDASNAGFGFWSGHKDNGGQGQWKDDEKELDINCKELLAVFYGLKALCRDDRNIHIRIMSDNKMTVAYIRDMGGIHSRFGDKIAKDIWNWCVERNIWISSAHIPGIINTEADIRSRKFDSETEWMLNPAMFKRIKHMFPINDSSIDLFATRINTQLPVFMSWKPDPDACTIDSFTADWGKLAYFYAFPPFSIIGRVLQKVIQDQAIGLIVVPRWETQPWFPTLMKMIIGKPLIFPPTDDLLILPNQAGKVHSLHKKLSLMACSISGKATLDKDTVRKQSTWHARVGEIPQ